MPICVTCNKDKPDNMYHTTGKNRTLKKSCKDCINEKRRKQRLANPDKYKAQDKTNYEKHKDKRKEAAKKYIKENYEKVKERKQKYYEQNKETIAKKNKEYYAANTASILQTVHAYYERNKEAILKQKKEYRQSEQGKLAAKNGRSRRRAKEKEACNGTICPDTLKTIANNQNNKCYYCKCEIDIKTPLAHIDHLTPLSRGGMHSIDNIVWSCASCNLKKNNKTEEEYNEYISTHKSTSTG